MRLAGEDDLHRAVLGSQDAQDALHVVEDERRALVGGEAAREADGQRVVAERLAGAHEFQRALAARGGLAAQAGAHELHQLAAERAAHLPEVGMADRRDRRPRVGIRRGTAEVDAHRAAPERARLGSDPRGDVHAVGDAADRHVVGAAAEDLHPHLATHAAVELGDAVDALGHAEGKHGHADRAAARVLSTELGEALLREAGVAKRAAERLPAHLGVVAVVAGGNGRVRREDRGLAHALHGLVERHAAGHELREALQSGERRVPLVQVEDSGLLLQLAERKDAADAEQHLLAHAELGLALVEGLREETIALAVLGDVRVEEIQRDAAHLKLPDLGAHHVAADRAVDVRARVHHREALEVVARVQDARGAVAAEFLQVIALPVQEADADERDAQVGGALQVVARQDAQAAGVLLHALVDGELAGEVRDPHAGGLGGVLLLVPGGGLVVGAARVGGVGDDLAEALVGDLGLQHAGVNAREDARGRMLGGLPEHRVQRGEGPLADLVPAEPAVGGQRAERVQGAERIRDARRGASGRHGGSRGRPRRAASQAGSREHRASDGSGIEATEGVR